MKKLICLSLLFLFAPVNSYAGNDEYRDFAIRMGGGVIQGVGRSPLAEFSSYADMYLFSQSLRMIFGFSLYNMGDTGIPNLSIQSIGVEQNFEFGPGGIFLGILYNKAYLSKDKSDYDPQRGESFQAGYKYHLDQTQDLVFIIGQQYQPLKFKGTLAKTRLSDKTVFVRIAMQWYF